MVHVHCVIMMAVLFLAKASAQCNHGEVRLVNGHVPSEGRVEICACRAMSCSWGTVCDDDWGDSDAQVVCRQLGYRPNGALALSRAWFGRGSGDIVLDDVQCDANEITLLECNHRGLFTHNCDHSEDAGVRCVGGVDSSLLFESITNVNVITSVISTCYTNFYTFIVTWKLQNTSQYSYQSNSFQIECFSHQHRIEMSVNYTTFSTHLVGLLPATSYNCCVSAEYEFYTTRGVCIETVTIHPPISQPSETPMIQPNESPAIQCSSCICATQGSNLIASSSADTIGGVLGFIIAILLVLLAMSGAALVYLLRQKFLGNVIQKVSVDRNFTEVPVRRNLCYATTLSHSATRAADQSETDAVADYSRIGPPYYETIDSRKQQPSVAITGRNQVTARLSEGYEFSEAHLAAVGSGGGGMQGEAVMEYEVPQNLSMRQIIEEHEEYSHV